LTGRGWATAALAIHWGRHRAAPQKSVYFSNVSGVRVDARWLSPFAQGTNAHSFLFGALTALALGALTPDISEPLPGSATARRAHPLKPGAYT